MTDVDVRAFRRDDREQLTALVNAHIAAVTPGATVSVNRVLSQLEREPGEFLLDRWVTTRTTLVAEQRGRIVAATHLLRYSAEQHVGEFYRDAGELRWFICYPEAPFWKGSMSAGATLVQVAVDVLRRSDARVVLADGGLPAPGVFGIPDVWPHVQKLLVDNGFRAGERVEQIYLLPIDDMASRSVPDPRLRVQRTLGTNGTRFSAWNADELVGYIEVDVRSTDIGRVAGGEGWADVGNLFVSESWRRHGVATWLLGEASEWLRWGGVRNLLDYADEGQHEYAMWLRHNGFRLLTATSRGWRLSR